MKKITLFIASSKELETDRRQMEIEIYRKCKSWYDKAIFLYINVWEDLSGVMSATRSQDEYNKVVKANDIFILLAHTKVGAYTAEEFESAFGQFQSTKKPFIFTYFKKTETASEPSLSAFKQKLKDLGHFYGSYEDFNDLWNQFNKELDRLEVNEFKEKKRLEDEPDGKTNTSIISGDGNIGLQNVKDSHIDIKGNWGNKETK